MLIILMVAIAYITLKKMPDLLSNGCKDNVHPFDSVINIGKPVLLACMDYQCGDKLFLRFTCSQRTCSKMEVVETVVKPLELDLVLHPLAHRDSFQNLEKDQLQ